MFTEADLRKALRAEVDRELAEGVPEFAIERPDPLVPERAPRRPVRLLAAAVVVVVVAAGAGAAGAFLTRGVTPQSVGTSVDPTPDRPTPQPTDGAALAYAIQVLAARWGMVDGVWFDRSLRDALPNVTFSIDGAPARSVLGGVVEGHVTAVEEGSAYRDEETENGSRAVEVDFGSPDASWRTVVLTVAVENDFDPSREAPDVLRLAVTFGAGADTETMLKAFAGRHVLAVLDPPNTFTPDPTLRTASRGSALLGLVADDGTISMPVLGEGEAEYLGDLTTIEAVTRAAQEPAQVIDVTLFGERHRED
ncbi:hypothetical protein [Cellulomonas composti]|uniref:Uncharacterized protein n=1 Tax=Cellulomonas composti TaxID=266130 RepID=A0A511JCP6_9CELL|nr:hypothetical protein [Cellulomonas composti]GEL95777.1 hypothetical protein CCO02nite_24350 [Cellulomonas composti]